MTFALFRESLMPSIVCPSCSKKLTFPEGTQGRTGTCPNCGQQVSAASNDPWWKEREEVIPLPTPAPKSPLPAAGIQTVSCPHCHGQMCVPPSLGGQMVACPHCTNRVQLPSMGHSPVPVYQQAPVRNLVTAQQPPPRRRRFAYDDEQGPRQHGGNAVSNSLGITALVLGIVGFVLSLVPCVGVVAIPIVGVGLLLGLGGLIASLARSGHGVGFSIGGLAVSAAGLVIALFWVGAIGSFTTSEPNRAPVEVRRDGDGAAAKKIIGAEEKKPPARSEWINARDGNALLDSVVVKIESAHVEYVNLEDLGRPAKSVEKHLVIRVSLHNSSDTRKVEYSGWGRVNEFAYWITGPQSSKTTSAMSIIGF